MRPRLHCRGCGCRGSGRACGSRDPARTRSPPGAPDIRPSARAGRDRRRPAREASPRSGGRAPRARSAGSAARSRQAIRLSRGPAREVIVGVLGREPLHLPPDPDLPVELAPVDHQRGARVGGELPALSALVVGEEAKTVGTEALEQDHPRIGRAMLVDGGQGHRLVERDVRPAPPRTRRRTAPSGRPRAARGSAAGSRDASGSRSRGYLPSGSAPHALLDPVMPIYSARGACNHRATR